MEFKSKHHVSKEDLKEDRFQEAIEKVAAAYYRDRKRFWIGGAVVLVAIIGLILLIQNRGRPAENAQAEFMLTEATVSYMQGDLSRAEEGFKELTRRYPGDYAGVKAHYYLGNVYYMSEQPKLEEAKREFATFLKKAPNDPVLSPAAQVGIANCEEQAGNSAAAAAAYEVAARKWPKSALAFEALMAAGRCYRNAGQLDHAEKAYRRLLDLDKLEPSGRADDVRIELAHVQALKNRF